jgi:hypothetical protein
MTYGDTQMSDLKLDPKVKHICVSVTLVIKGEIAGQVVMTTIESHPKFSCEVASDKADAFMAAMQKLLREYDDEIPF